MNWSNLMYHFLCFRLQYACCLRYDIQRDRTAHLFTHQINVDYEELRTAIYEFALDNTTWIEKVGRDALLRAKLTLQDFIKGLHNRTVFFDELCILITCRTFNVHCVVLLDGVYWSTWPNNDLHDCLIKIAYIGDFGFKEVQTEVYQSLTDEASHESELSEPELAEAELSCSNDDLQGTGLNSNGKTSKESCDSAHENLSNQNSEQDQEQNQNEHNEESLDVKPMVRHLITFTSTAKEPVVISDSDEEEPKDVKPLIKAHVKITVDANDPIVLSDNEEPIQDQNNTTQNTTAVVPAAQKIAKKYQHIKRDHSYTCYLCGETFQMQYSFVTHF